MTPKKSMSVAYSLKKQAERRRFAKGGEIDARDEHMSGIDDAREEREMDMLDSKSLKHKAEQRAGTMMSDIDDEDDMELDMVSAIRRKYAKGGMVDDDQVDLQENNGDEEDTSGFPTARKKTYYDDSQLEDQPEDSSLHGDDLEDADEHDMVGSIRRKMKKRI